MEECPKTCNFCKSVTPSFGCADRSIDCRTWVKNGFCQLYPDNVKQQLCPGSCGLC
ncbi:hypothetical protein AAVH_22833 [Aphelenchoides avenae]|nr:hypothetical protein AAVH_22833 [Aphelenchus avenae]